MQKEKVSARAMAKTRLMQTLGEEEFGLTQQQISVIGQQASGSRIHLPHADVPILRAELVFVHHPR